MPIFHTAILLYDKKQFAIPAIATEQESRNGICTYRESWLLEQILPFANFSSYAVIGLFDKILAIVDYWSGCE